MSQNAPVKLEALVHVPKEGTRYAERGETFETSDHTWARHLVAIGYAERVGGAELKGASSSEDASLDEVAFTSESAEESAREAGLSGDDFAEGEGSGSDGAYTVADVESLSRTTEDE